MAYDDEYDDDEFDVVDDETSVVPCPHCGAHVYEDADRCPACGDYIIPGTRSNALSGRPLWWVALGLAGVIAVIATLMLF